MGHELIDGTMIKGLTQIASESTEMGLLAHHVRRKKVLLPLPFCQMAVDRTSLPGRISVMAESVMDYYNPKWTKGWWQSFFDEASKSGDLGTDPRYEFYKASRLHPLDSKEAQLQVTHQAYDALCPQTAIDSVSRKYQRSILHTGTPSPKSRPFDTHVFRSLFNLAENHTGKTLLSMLSYSLDCLKQLAPRSETLLNLVSKRVDEASKREHKITQIIAGGRKPKLRAQAHRQMLSLAKEMESSSQGLLNGGSLLFKGGCGTSNKQMRDLMHSAFTKTQSNSIAETLKTLKLSDVAKKGYSEAEKKFGPESSWNQYEVSKWLISEFLPANLKDFEAAFRTTYPSLVSDFTAEEKRNAYLFMKGWKKGKTTEFEKHLTERLLHQAQNAYGHLLSDGVFERFFDECGDNIIEGVKDACGYLSDEWQSGLSTFLEKGTFDGVPDHVKKWLPEKFSEEFAKTMHTGLQKILTDDVFPGDSSKEFLNDLFEASKTSGLENGFRSAFSELMQTRLVDSGFEKYNTELSSLLNHLPPEVQSAFNQMGVGAPETQIWYDLSKDQDGQYQLKVFSCPNGAEEVQQTVYQISDAKKLNQTFFFQLIQFRVKPRISEDVSYSLDDVHTFISQHLEEKSIQGKEYRPGEGNPFQNFSSSQKLIYALMQDQLGFDVAKEHLYDIRKQALIDMNAQVKADPEDYTYLQEGAESLAGESKLKDQDALEEAFDTFWDISANAPDQETKAEKSMNALVNSTMQKKLRTLLASLGFSWEHIRLLRRIIQGAFGADMGPTVDAFVQELLGNHYKLSKVPEDELIDLGAKIGGIESIYTLHSVMSAYVGNRIAQTESVCLKMALQTVRLMLWTIKVTLGTVVPLALKITPQVIKDLVYLLFMFFLSITLPIVAKVLVWAFMKSENIEAFRQMAFEYQRVYTRTGGLDFSLDKDQKHHLHLFNWFREPEDIKVLDTNNDRTKITKFSFKSLNLVFDVNPVDGRAYVDESKRQKGKPKKLDGFFVAESQKLPKGMKAFSKFLVLENAAGEKRVILAEDSLDATVSSNLGISVTRQNASPHLSRVFQSWADNLFPSHRKETAYFVYDYNAEDGRLESDNSCAMSYLLFYHVTKGELKEAQRIMDQLSVLAEQQGHLTKTLEPLLRRIHVFCMLHPDRRTLFFGLKLAALREKFELKGKKSKRDRLAPATDEDAWEWLDAIGLQASLLRYQDMKHRLLSPPLTDAEEYRVLKRLERRLEKLREKFVDPSVKENISLGNIAANAMPTWASALASKAWGFAPSWAHNKKDSIESGIKQLYDNNKSSLSNQLMAPSLQKRLAELEEVNLQTADTVKTRAAYSWLPRFVAKSFADPLNDNPYLNQLPFENKEELPFISHLDRAFGLSSFSKLRHLIGMPVGKIPETISSKRHVLTTDLSLKELRIYFFDYYRLAKGEGGTPAQQKAFKTTLACTHQNDPIILLLKQVVRAPKDFPTAEHLSRALTLETLKLDNLPKQKVTNAPKLLTEQYLKSYFFQYYALAHGDGSGAEFAKKSRDFKNEIAKIDRIDPITQLLQDVAKSHKRKYPSVDLLKEAYNAPRIQLEDLFAQMRKSIIQNKDISVISASAPTLTSSNIKTHFLDFYRLALAKDQNLTKELDKVVGRFDPMTNFLLSALKIASKGQGVLPSFKVMENAFIQAAGGNDTPLRKALKDLKTACQDPYREAEFEQKTKDFPEAIGGKKENLLVLEGKMTAALIRQNMVPAFMLAKGRGDKNLVKAFRLQIGSLVDTSNDPKLNFFIITLSLISQNPDAYPQHFKRKECIAIARKQLRESTAVDVARQVPASLLSQPPTDQQNSSWFSFGKVAGVVSGAFSVLNAARKQDLKTVGKQAVEQVGSMAAWATKTPVPLNSLLYAAEHLSENTSAARAQTAKKVVDAPLSGVGFAHSDDTINAIMTIDNAMSFDMYELIRDHTHIANDGKYAFKTEQDYFHVRQGLDSRNKHLQTLIKGEMKKIVDYANSKPIDFNNFAHRQTLLTEDELFKLFIRGDQESLAKRTDLNPLQVEKLVTMMLAYQQLQTHAEFLSEWQQKLTGLKDILGYRFEQKDYTLTRPFDWSCISVDQLRIYFLRASVSKNRQTLSTAKLAQSELHAFHKLLPGYSRRGWRREPLARRLMTRTARAN